jgi:hypothetical protein
VSARVVPPRLAELTHGWPAGTKRACLRSPAARRSSPPPAKRRYGSSSLSVRTTFMLPVSSLQVPNYLLDDGELEGIGGQQKAVAL